MGDDEAERWARQRAASLLMAQRRQQEGVVTYAQLVAGGTSRAELVRAQRHNELRRVHPRVYVDHTGPLTWRQRAWAAVLYAEPAYLCWTSLEAPRRDDPSSPIHVAIDRSRRIRPQPGIVVHHLADLDSHAYGGTPPRLKMEDNVLAMAHVEREEIDVIARLAEVAGRPYVTPDSLRAALDRFGSLRRRAWIAGIVDDLETGAHSVLEHGYLTKVERPHGLPNADRQTHRITPGGSQFRDVEYAAYGLVVELDGALGHDTWRDQGRDADRELDDLAATGAVTARIRYQQVFGDPCRTAARLGRILRTRGWEGRPRRCAPRCSIEAV